MSELVCRICEKAFPDDRSYWHYSGKYLDRCKGCWNEHVREYRRNNRERLNIADKERRERDPEAFRARRRAHYAANNDRLRQYARDQYALEPEKFAERKREDRRNNPERYREIDARKYRNDPIGDCIRRGISHSLSRNGQVKGGRKFLSLVDWKVEELRAHLQSLFEEGMSFDNYGEWHVDHIVAKSLVNFDSPDSEAFRRLWGLGNLAPLWAADNMAKTNDPSWVLPDSYKNVRLRDMYDLRDYELAAGIL